MVTNAFDSDAVRPVHVASKEFDVEKSINPISRGVETSSDGGYKSDDSQMFQPGVRRVRAITEIWSKKTLITMFVL
jgi:hypothetical protein